MTYKFLEIVNMKVEDIERVDCGNCPVNIGCAAGIPADGFIFNCCKTVSLGYGNKGTVIDCHKHKFRGSGINGTACPLCSGAIIDAALVSNDTDTILYLPTVHAAVPIGARLHTWRQKLPKAVEDLAKATERKRKLRT